MIEYLNQNVIFHVTKHEITTSHVTKLDMKWNMKWYIIKKESDDQVCPIFAELRKIKDKEVFSQNLQSLTQKTKKKYVINISFPEGLEDAPFQPWKVSVSVKMSNHKK